MFSRRSNIADPTRNHGQRRVGGKKCLLSCESAGQRQIINVLTRDEFALRLPATADESLGQTLILLPQNAYPRICVGVSIKDIGGPVGRTVIDDDEFERHALLVQNTVQCSMQ